MRYDRACFSPSLELRPRGIKRLPERVEAANFSTVTQTLLLTFLFALNVPTSNPPVWFLYFRIMAPGLLLIFHKRDCWKLLPIEICFWQVSSTLKRRRGKNDVMQWHLHKQRHWLFSGRKNPWEWLTTCADHSTDQSMHEEEESVSSWPASEL